ncbi:MAG: ABC transporter permease, partial [Fervidobacterium sp.]
SKTLHKVFEKIKQFKVEFVNIQNETNQLENYAKKLEKGDIDLVIKLPESFDSRYTTALLLKRTKLLKKIPIEIYYVPQRDSSKLAKNIVKGIFESLDVLESVQLEEHILIDNKYDYNNFIYPGVIGMAILSTFLFGFMNELEYFHRGKLIRRFLVTPINIVWVYVLSAIVNVIELFIGVFILSIVAYLKGVDVIGYLPSVIFNLFLSSATMISFVLALMTFIKKASNLFVFQQVFFQVQMFIGGFYIPLRFTHPIIQNLARLMPITYIVDGMRSVRALNSFESGHILIPLIYILVSCLIIAFRGERFQKE